jgi:hypothetical protein
MVGLPDKAVSEARERVRTALSAMAIALPSKRITVNLSPADLPKEGSHFDLPIALALLAALDIIPREKVEEAMALGELSLDGSLVSVIGALPTALAAGEDGRVLYCPQGCGAEAAWVGATTVYAAPDLARLIAHLTERAPLEPARPGEVIATDHPKCLSEVRGQERAKRALEIAAPPFGPSRQVGLGQGFGRNIHVEPPRPERHDRQADAVTGDRGTDVDPGGVVSGANPRAQVATMLDRLDTPHIGDDTREHGRSPFTLS